MGIRRAPPLAYVLRNNEVNDWNFNFVTREDRLIAACATLIGPQFKQDDNKVYSLLLDYFKDPTGMAIIAKYKTNQ